MFLLYKFCLIIILIYFFSLDDLSDFANNFSFLAPAQVDLFLYDFYHDFSNPGDNNSDLEEVSSIKASKVSGSLRRR